MFKSTRKLAMALAATTVLTGPTMLMADGVGSAVRDAAVANAGRTQALVPCPRLNRNIPASLASEMDCGRAVPLVAGERVRNTGGGLFGGHRIGSAPPANNDDDTPISVPDSMPPSGGDGATDDGDQSDDDGPSGDDGPGDDGNDSPPTNTPPNKWDRLNELGIERGDLGEQDQAFRDEVTEYRRENGSDGDWSNFNPETAPIPSN